MVKLCCWLVLLVGVPAAADEGIVFSRPPGQRIAWESDTDYYLYGDIVNSQRVADDLTIDAPATVRRVVWWGNYGSQAEPPTSETMRIRFYDARPSDGLPGNLLLEEDILNPLRSATGRIDDNASGGAKSPAPEYEFTADLATPFSLQANTRYWLEIAQIGDRSSRFHWAFSDAAQNGFAFANPADAQWRSDSSRSDPAFQLSTIPEPATLALITLGVGLAGRRRTHVR